MKIKVEPFLMKKGKRVAKAAIEFEQNDGILAGFHMVGFTVCDDTVKGLYVLFPASVIRDIDGNESNKRFFFLRPTREELLGELEHKILDVYEGMIAVNNPRIK